MQSNHARRRIMAGLFLLALVCTITLLDIRIGVRPVTAQEPGDGGLRLTATSMAATLDALGAAATQQASNATRVAELNQLATQISNQQATSAAGLQPPPTSTRAATPTLKATARPAPTRTPRATVNVAEALVSGLNIRSGPGTSYPVIGSAAENQRLTVTGQSNSCAWLRVMLPDGREGWVSGAPQFTRFAGSCSGIATVAGSAQPTATTRSASANQAARAASPQPVQAAASASGLITSFEPMGSWRRGDQVYGTLESSSAQVAAGQAAAQLQYDFPAGIGANNYVVFLAQPQLAIPQGATSLQIAVYGDGAGHYLNTWIVDSRGQVWQLTFGRVTHRGWATMQTALTASKEWPNGPIDASSDVLAPPLTVRALVLDGVPDDNVARKGSIYLDDLRVGGSATGAAGGSTASPVTVISDAATAPVEVTSASGPVSGKIAFSRFNGNTMNVLVFDAATGRMIIEAPNTRQPDLFAGVLLLNGDGGDMTSIYRRAVNDVNRNPATSNVEDSYPQWSPSGASFVYASQKVGDRRSRLYLQADASAQANVAPMLYNGSELFGNYPVYLDNWRIAYNGCDSWDTGGRCGIYTTDSKGGRPARITELTDDIPSGNLGSQILFTSRRNGSYDVWIINWDGSGLRALTDDPANDGLGVGSPDGTRIAFVSDRGGQWAIWVMNADGSSPQKLFNLDGGYADGERSWLSERISWGS